MIKETRKEKLIGFAIFIAIVALVVISDYLMNGG